MLIMNRGLVAFLFLGIAVSGILRTHASDPELTTDFKVPEGVNGSTLDGNFFTNTDFRDFEANADNSPFPTAVRADVTNFTALDGLGVSSVIFAYLPGNVNPPHIHPRGTELLFVIEGTLETGFVDTTNKLRITNLKKGDLFVIPKALVHFQKNKGTETTKVLSFFSSSNPGVVRLPAALFGSNIPDRVLEKSFGVSADVVSKLKAAQVV